MKAPFIQHLSWLSCFGFAERNKPATLRPLANPFEAIVWSLWIGGAKTFTQSMIAASILFLVIRSIFSHEIVIQGSMWFIFFQSIKFLNVFINLEDSDDFNKSYSKRMFALPISSGSFVLLITAIDFVSAAFFAATIDLAFLYPIGFGAPVVPLILGSAAALALVRAFSLSPIEPAWAKPYLAVIVLAALVGIACWTIQIVHASNTIISLVFMSYLIGAFFVALKGVERSRRGDFFRIGNKPSIHIQTGAIVVPRFRRFRSAAEAQFLLEWSFLGWIPAIISTVAPILIGTELYFLSKSSETNKISFINPVILLLPVILSFVYSYALPGFKPILTEHKDRLEYFLLRPMRTNDFIKVKFLAALFCTLSNWVGFLIMAAIGLVHESIDSGIDRSILNGNSGWMTHFVTARLTSPAGALLVVTMIGLSWNCATFMLAASLDRSDTGVRKPMSIFIASIVTILSLAVIFGMNILDWIFYFIINSLYVSPFLTIWKIARSIVAYRKALDLKLIGVGTVALGVCVWIGLSACTLATIGLIFAEFSSVRFWIVGVSVVTTITPLGRFALAPLMLHQNRHQC
jgi:hypothetical protein